MKKQDTLKSGKARAFVGGVLLEIVLGLGIISVFLLPGMLGVGQVVYGWREAARSDRAIEGMWGVLQDLDIGYEETRGWWVWSESEQERYFVGNDIKGNVVVMMGWNEEGETIWKLWKKEEVLLALKEGGKGEGELRGLLGRKKMEEGMRLLNQHARWFEFSWWSVEQKVVAEMGEWGLIQVEVLETWPWQAKWEERIQRRFQYRKRI